jgi:hypothetical protein
MTGKERYIKRVRLRVLLTERDLRGGERESVADNQPEALDWGKSGCRENGRSCQKRSQGGQGPVMCPGVGHSRGS